MVPKSPSIEIAATKISFLHLIFPSVRTMDADFPSELSCVSIMLQAFRFPQLYVISHSQEQLQSLVCAYVMVFALCLNTGIIVPAIIWKFHPSAGSYFSTSIPSPADEAQSRPLKKPREPRAWTSPGLRSCYSLSVHLESHFQDLILQKRPLESSKLPELCRHHS